MSYTVISRSRHAVGVALSLMVLTARPISAISPCGADCDGDGRVTVNELVTVVGALTSDQPATACTDADLNQDGRFAVNEVVFGVNNLLAGCPSARVDALIEGLISPDSPGVAILIADHGEILHSRGYGFADIEREIPMTPQTYMNIASVTKTFTATAILMLAERGHLDIDDPVSMYLPELERFGDGMTVRHLLTHTSGLPDYFVHDTELFARWLEVDPAVAEEAVGLLFPYPADPIRFAELLRDARLVDSLRLAAILSEYGTPLSEPGEAYNYSNTGYDMLDAIVTRVSGQPSVEFMRENVLTAAGMTGSFLLGPDARVTDPDVARTYGRHGDTLVAYPILPWLAFTGSGELYASVEELYAYDQALYGDTLLSQATLTEAFTPYVLNDGSIAGDAFGLQGLGWQILELSGARAMWHAGGGFGVTTALLRFPERQLTVVALLNTDDRVEASYGALLPIIDLYLKLQDVRGR